MGLADLELLKEADVKLFLAVSSVLRICAVLRAGMRIPRAVIAAAVQRMGLSERAVVAELSKRGLLVEDARTRSVTMAAATQAEVLAGAGDADKLRVRAAALLVGVWPQLEEMRSSTVGLDLGRELVPHGVHLVDTCVAEGKVMWDVAVMCADTLRSMGSLAETARMHRRLVALGTAMWGAEDPRVLQGKMFLGQTLSGSGQLREAAAVLEETLTAMWKVLGNDHEMTLQCTGMFAEVLQQQGDPRALEVASGVVANLRRVAGPRAEETLSAMGTLGLVQREFGKLEEAEATQRSVVEARTAVHGEESVETLTALQLLAGTLCKRGKYAEAERMHRRAVEGTQRVCGMEHMFTIGARYELCDALIEQGKLDEARTILQRLACMPAGKRGELLTEQHIEQRLARITALEQQRASPQ